MRLKSFSIQNYKSIIDSGECRLSDVDNILVLAGQNESGKSSILQALRDFEIEEIDLDSFRDDDSNPSIWYLFSDVENSFDNRLFEDMEIPEKIQLKILSLKELRIIKTFNAPSSCSITCNEELITFIEETLEFENGVIRQKNEELKKEENSEDQIIEEWDIPLAIEDILIEISRYTPKVIFFDDFCDLLPDKILISDIKAKNKEAKGYQAVKNIETILGADFIKLDGLSDNRKETTQNNYHETITADFNEKWKQRIAEGNGAKVHVKHYRDSAGTAYLKFYIETKKGEFLSVGKRSQGFKWFLSFYLQLKAEDKNTNSLIVLFDEPGLYLHSKAQLDMIAVFEELAKKNQIIYSTHSPYLIDTSKLNRVKLVLNTKGSGTTIEKITSNRIQNQKDALKPVIDAMGLEIASPFSIAQKNNVILEGISDFYYLSSMKRILNKKYEIGLLPSMGSSNCHLLMELCIGWGLNWMIIFDDKGAVKDYNKIKRSFFYDDDKKTQEKIFRLKDFDGIEDMFGVGDMKLVKSDSQFSSDRKNSDVVEECGGKELYARLFYEKVVSGEITKEKLSQSASKNFLAVFSFIEETFGL